MMTNNLLKILAIIAAVLFLLSVWTYHSETSSLASVRDSGKLLPTFNIDAIASIELAQGEDLVTMRRVSANAFVLSSHNDYVVDIDAVNELLLASSDIEIDRLITSDKDRYKELGVREVSVTAETVRVSFLDEDDKGIKKYLIGKTNESRTGTYVRLVDADEVFLTKGTVFIKIKKMDYVNKQLIDLKEKPLVSVKRSGSSSFTLTHKSEKLWQLDKIPEGRENNDEGDRDLIPVILSLKMTDFFSSSDPELKGLIFDEKIDMTFDNKSIYTILAAKKDSHYYVKLSARWTQELRVNPNASDEENAKLDILVKAFEATNKFIKDKSVWIFEISAADYGRITRTVEDVSREIPPPPPENGPGGPGMGPGGPQNGLPGNGNVIPNNPPQPPNPPEDENGGEEKNDEPKTEGDN